MNPVKIKSKSNQTFRDVLLPHNNFSNDLKIGGDVKNQVLEKYISFWVFL